MGSGFTVDGVDLDSILNTRVNGVIGNTGFLAGGSDIANRYEKLASGSAPALTGFKVNGSDLNSLFAAAGTVNTGRIFTFTPSNGWGPVTLTYGSGNDAANDNGAFLELDAWNDMSDSWAQASWSFLGCAGGTATLTFEGAAGGTISVNGSVVAAISPGSNQSITFSVPTGSVTVSVNLPGSANGSVYITGLSIKLITGNYTESFSGTTFPPAYSSIVKMTGNELITRDTTNYYSSPASANLVSYCPVSGYERALLYFNPPVSGTLSVRVKSQICNGSGMPMTAVTMSNGIGSVNLQIGNRLVTNCLPNGSSSTVDWTTYAVGSIVAGQGCVFYVDANHDTVNIPAISSIRAWIDDITITA